MKKNLKKAFSLIEISVVLLILGILTAGVIQGSKMVDLSRLNKARLLTTNSGIDQIPNLIAWYESTLPNSIVSADSTHKEAIENNDLVSTWKDISDFYNTEDLTQSSGTEQPLYIKKAINNLPALKFDGSNDYLARPFNASLNNYEQTVFVVVKTISHGDYGAIYSSRDDYPKRGQFIYATPDGDYTFNLGASTGEWTEAQASPITLNQRDLLSFVIKKSSSFAYHNGASTGFGSGEHLVQTAQEYAVGAARHNGATSFAYNGYIGEFIVFERALNATERQFVESYLAKKWGVELE